jgi:hypothetical protein
MDLEKILFYYFLFGIALIPAVHGLRYANIKYRQWRRLQRKVRTKQSPFEFEFEVQGNQVQSLEIMWNDIVSHDKADELVKLNGTINDVANYYLIANIGAFRSFGIIQISVGDKLLTPREGSKTLANLKGGNYLIIRYSSDDGITVDLSPFNENSEGIFASDSGAFMAVENKISLIKGNSILIHYKEKEPSCHYIKHWEMPTSFASFAAFSDSSSIASTAQKLVSAGAFYQNQEGHQGKVPVVAELLEGSFYVLGADCTDKLKFIFTDHLAIRLISYEETSGAGGDELNHVMSAIQALPLVHLKIRLDELKIPFVVFKRENDFSESTLNLKKSNMMVTIPVSTNDDLEIIKLEHCEQSKGFPVIQLTLNKMRENHCPYVVVWKY